MENKFFLHQIKVTNGTIEKGIAVKNTLDEALQSYHAYLGAYAYGQNEGTTFVDVMITEELSQTILMRDQWIKQTEPNY